VAAAGACLRRQKHNSLVRRDLPMPSRRLNAGGRDGVRRENLAIEPMMNDADFSRSRGMKLGDEVLGEV
jgi:hypothetical protein